MKKAILSLAAVALFTTMSASAGYDDPCTITNPCVGSGGYESGYDDGYDDRYEDDRDYYEDERRHQETLDAIRSLRSCDDIWPIEKQVHARTYGQCQ